MANNRIVTYKTTHHNRIGNHTWEEANSPKTVMKINFCEIRWHLNIAEVRKYGWWKIQIKLFIQIYFLNIPRCNVLLSLEYHPLKHSRRFSGKGETGKCSLSRLSVWRTIKKVLTFPNQYIQYKSFKILHFNYALSI